MKTIELTQGKTTVVDDATDLWARSFKWHARKDRQTFYAGRGVKEGNRVRIILLHREILKAAPGFLVDHRDRDGLNNIRKNLRLCSPAQNSQNKKRRVDNLSGYRGVWFHKLVGKWTSQIVAQGRKHHLGYYSRAKEAAVAYDKAAVELHGEFARLNFPREAF